MMEWFWQDRLAGEPADLDQIHASPGHLIRRSQQISASIFADEVGEFDLTSVQYAALAAVRARPGIDQRALGRAVAIDRSTVGGVVAGLERRGLVTRATSEADGRVRVLHLSDEGRQLLDKSAGAVVEVQRRLLAPLDAEERRIFLRLISKLVEVNNIHSRVPLAADDRVDSGKEAADVDGVRHDQTS